MNKELNTSFLGRGWSFPPQFNKRVDGVGDLAMSEDEKDIRESLSILLGTRKGERIMLPSYGCDLIDMTFDNMTTSFRSYIIDQIRSAIIRYESRINLHNITIRAERMEEGFALVDIDYSIVTTNTRTNFVYPFYINEGTDL